MRNIGLILSLFACFSVYGQWQPKQGNPYKWYHIQKDTSIMDIQMTGFDVCIYQGCWQYNKFNVDSLGRIQPPIISAVVWFREYANGTKEKQNVSRPFNDYAVEFMDLPFGCEDGELGVSNIVNQWLSTKYNVTIENIIE